jgi:mannose/fructose/N-acetylgalactosamine-specific phosphotransferase system component IID
MRLFARSKMQEMKNDDRGLLSLGPVLAIVGVVLAVIIGILVLAALAPTFFQAVADITGALTDADLNNSLANTIAGIVAILVPLALLFVFVALVFKFGHVKKGGGY